MTVVLECGNHGNVTQIPSQHLFEKANKKNNEQLKTLNKFQKQRQFDDLMYYNKHINGC